MHSTAAREGLQHGNYGPFQKQDNKQTRVGIKVSRVSGFRNVVEKSRWWKRPSLGEKHKWDGQEPKIGVVAHSSKIRTENKIKSKEAMLKIISPGKVEGTRPLAKVPMVVGGPRIPKHVTRSRLIYETDCRVSK